MIYGKTIGIGISTFARPEVFKRCIQYIKKYSTCIDTIIICEDYYGQKYADDIISKSDIKIDTHILSANQRMGVAESKNLCLSKLKKCDFIVLFDDDCFPKQIGWEKLLIDKHLISGCHHFQLIDPDFLKKFKVNNYFETKQHGITSHSIGNGCMLFITKKVIETVGGFNPNYDTWGYEHIGYSCRIFNAGLNGDYGEFLCFEEMKEYFISLDFIGIVSSTISDEEKRKFDDINLPIVNEECETKTFYEV